MTTVNVQFQDSTKQVVVSYFANAQDPKAYPNQGQIDLSDARYATFYNSLPLLATPAMPAPQAAAAQSS